MPGDRRPRPWLAVQRQLMSSCGPPPDDSRTGSMAPGFQFAHDGALEPRQPCGVFIESEHPPVQTRCPDGPGSPLNPRGQGAPPLNGALMTSNRQTDDTPNVLPFRRNLRRPPLCAQCHIAMAIVRGEPDLADSTTITIYRCPKCGLLERGQI